jgi:hypothetical protein
MRNTSSSGPPDRFVARPPGQPLGDRVEVADAGVEVGGDDRVADAAERHAQQRIVLAGARPRRRIDSPIAMISAQVNA